MRLKRILWWLVLLVLLICCVGVFFLTLMILASQGDLIDGLVVAIGQAPDKWEGIEIQGDQDLAFHKNLYVKHRFIALGFGLTVGGLSALALFLAGTLIIEKRCRRRAPGEDSQAHS